MAIKDVQEILTLMADRGNTAYFGERISILEHSLQCAYFAERDETSARAITAALLHDIGHLLHGLPEDIVEQGNDGLHEELAAIYLEPWFGEDITTPIRMHVAAKRYLCSVEPGYLSQLSPASVDSLNVQGGPMNRDEVDAFEAQPYSDLAVQLRRWDDEAKIPNFEAPRLEHYLPHLRLSARK